MFIFQKGIFPFFHSQESQLSTIDDFKNSATFDKHVEYFFTIKSCPIYILYIYKNPIQKLTLKSFIFLYILNMLLRSLRIAMSLLIIIIIVVAIILSVSLTLLLKPQPKSTPSKIF